MDSGPICCDPIVYDRALEGFSMDTAGAKRELGRVWGAGQEGSVAATIGFTGRC